MRITNLPVKLVEGIKEVLSLDYQCTTPEVGAK